MRTGLAPLLPADLSAQEGVYYQGTVPGGTIPTLWAYVERVEPKKEAPRYRFVDCMCPAEAEEPLVVGFTASEVGEYLSRV